MSERAPRRQPRPLRVAPPHGRARGPALLAEPRGAAGDAGVPGLPAPRVPRARVRVRGPRGPPAVPEDHGRVDGAGRPHRLHAAAGGEDRPLRAPARGHDPRPAALLRHRGHRRRLRHRRARREPHGPADQDRRQPRAPGEPRRHRRARPGRHPRPLRSRPLADPHLPRRDPGLGRLRLPRCARRSTRSAAWAAPGCASSPRPSPRRPSPRRWTRSSTEFPAAKWHQWEPAGAHSARAGAVLAFGRPPGHPLRLHARERRALPRRRLRRAPAPAASATSAITPRRRRLRRRQDHDVPAVRGREHARRSRAPGRPPPAA